MRRRISILGIFAADLTFLTPRLPAWGETVLGAGFRTGPGGKGSNQALAAARLGGDVGLIARVGRDAFGEMARSLHAEAGTDLADLSVSATHPTGTAAIIVDAARGENAIIVVPGAAGTLAEADITAAEPRIAASAIFLTQLELPLPVARAGLTLARRHGARTILNPAPAAALDDGMLALADILTPNETEAGALAGMAIETVADAERAARALRTRGVGSVIVTLGANGALVCTARATTHIPAVATGRVIDTTGAGDAFNGALAVALAEGASLEDATRFGAAAAGLAVTRPGAAPPLTRAEITALV